MECYIACFHETVLAGMALSKLHTLTPSGMPPNCKYADEDIFRCSFEACLRVVSGDDPREQTYWHFWGLEHVIGNRLVGHIWRHHDRNHIILKKTYRDGGKSQYKEQTLWFRAAVFVYSGMVLHTGLNTYT